MRQMGQLLYSGPLKADKGWRPSSFRSQKIFHVVSIHPIASTGGRGPEALVDRMPVGVSAKRIALTIRSRNHQSVMCGKAEYPFNRLKLESFEPILMLRAGGARVLAR